MKTKSITIFLAILLSFGSVSAQYDFEPLNFNAGCGAANGICSFGRGINNRGDVVGWGNGGVLSGGPPAGFLLDKHGNLTVLTFPGAVVTQANGINDHGDIVGLYAVPGPAHAYLRDNDGTYSTIDFPGSTSSQAWGINNRGDVVGQYEDSSGTTHAYVRYKNGSFSSFDFPAGMIASGTLIYTRFRDINDHGQIVGYYRVMGGTFTALEIHGYILDKKGRITHLDFPVGAVAGEDYYATLAHGINNQGFISGGYFFADTMMGAPLEHGFVRSPKGVFSTVDFPGMLQTEIYEISENGVLVGGAQNMIGESNAFVAQ